jgi:hypothetical protein
MPSLLGSFNELVSQWKNCLKADAEEKENKAAKAAYEAALRKAVGEAVTNYGVNVNDPNVAAALIDAIDRNKNVSGFKGSNVVDPRDVARAVHEVLSTPTLGDSLQGLESASYITTLKSFGVATVTMEMLLGLVKLGIAL